MRNLFLVRECMLSAKMPLNRLIWHFRKTVSPRASGNATNQGSWLSGVSVLYEAEREEKGR